MKLWSENAWTCPRIWWSKEAYAHGIPSFNKEEDIGWRRCFSLQLVVELRIPTIPFLTSSVGLVVQSPIIFLLWDRRRWRAMKEFSDRHAGIGRYWRSNMSRLSLVLIATLNTNRWEMYHKTQNFQHSNRKLSPRLLIQVWARRCCWRDKSPSMLMADGRTVCSLSLVLENLNATMWDSMYRGKTQNFQHPMNRNQSPIEIPRLSVRALLQARKRSEHADDGSADLHVSSFFSLFSRLWTQPGD